jgi:hypothetical protein
MTIEQVERYDVDQLWLSLERCQHIGREAGRRVPLTRDPLADVAHGIDQLGAIGQDPQAVVDQTAVGIGDMRPAQGP